jgi:hypothetical protein
MRFIRLQGAALVCTLALASVFTVQLMQQPAYSQATNEAGAISGTVTDPSGAVVPSATVTITNVAKGSEKVLKTSSGGFYSSEALEPGSYTIHIDAAGFSAANFSLVVQVGQTANGNVKLGLQGTTTEVQVEATAVQVDTSSSSVQGVLNRQEIEALPLNGRNFLDMAQLQPGVQIQDGTSFDPTKNGFASISFGGRFGRTARITLDGVDISDENVGTTTQNISEDAIQEFQIAESSLDISTSLTSSGSVNIVSRTGTNKFHGDGFYNFRDQRAGNAEPTGYTVIPGVDSDYLQRNNMGAAFGGPLMRDKMFFFGQYEYFRQNVFNPVVFGGDLASEDGGYPVKFHEHLTLGRLDWNLPHEMRAFFRWNYNNNSDVAAFGGSNYSPFLNRDNTPGYAGGLDFASGRFTHSFRAGYFKFVNHITDATNGSGIFNPTPGINLNIPADGFSTGANFLAPQATVQSNRQFKYDGSWVKGTHTLRYGIGFALLRGGGYASFFGLAPQVNTVLNAATLAQAKAGPFPGGSANPLNYPAGGGGSDTVILGNGEGFFTEIKSFGFPGGGQFDDRFNIYFSDTWKINPKLTVNYGLRYVRDTGRDDEDLPAIPILDQVLPGLGDRTNEPNLNYGPQAGFAYDLKGNGKTVIRAGAGLYYENNVWNNVLFDRPPKLQEGLFFGTAEVCPGGSVPLPGGNSITTVDGVSIASLCGQPVGNVYKQFADLQTAYQTAVKAAGPQANGNYLGNAMAVPNAAGLELFSPNYKTPSSYQMNLGVQHEIRPGIVVSADYVRSVGIHFLVGQDVNHVGDARYLNLAGANAAIAKTLTACGVATVDEAIIGCPGLHPAVGTTPVGPAVITDFAANGLDSEDAVAGGYPGANAAFAGNNTNWGQVLVLYPSGRSVYNALDISIQGQVHHLAKGADDVSLQTSYTLSRYEATGTTTQGDADFGGNAWDNNNPTKNFGPTSLDRKNQFSIGVTAKTFGGVEFDTIAHLYSSLPTNLFLPTVGVGDIFTDDWTGSGALGMFPSGTGFFVPGSTVGAFGRKYNGANINGLISNYNKQYAGKLTPAGQAVVTANLLTSTQMTELGGVLESVTPAPQNQASNDILRTFDITLGRTIHVRERFSARPTIAFFNVLNAANYNNRTGNNGFNVITGQLNGLADSPNGTAGHISEQNLRVSAGSGVYAEGSPRQLEFGMKLNF